VQEANSTALLNACFRLGNAEVVKLLLEKGADVSTKVDCGATAWMLANVTGNPKIMELLNAQGVTSKKP